VAEKILAILETDTGCAEAMAERVSQIMYPHFGQPGSIPRLFPGVVSHL